MIRMLSNNEKSLYPNKTFFLVINLIIYICTKFENNANICIKFISRELKFMDKANTSKYFVRS